MESATNSPLVLVLAGLLCGVIIGAIAWFVYQRRRTASLKSRFGPEYDRQIQTHGSASKAEVELEQRAKRVDRFTIVDLSPADRDRFNSAWLEDQARFVDSPKAAVIDADRIVTEVMQRRGYPMGDFEQLAADVSVDHPLVVENYRSAHLIASRSERGEADTEDLRKAMIHYRALFKDLLGAETTRITEVRR